MMHLGGFVPANPLSLASHISDKLAVHSPGLTFDVITEFARGFHKSSASHKAACIYYLSPWIKNLSTFPDLISTYGHNSGGKLRETFRILIELLVKDFEVSIVPFTEFTNSGNSISSLSLCSTRRFGLKLPI
jgi:neurofibromin 1